MIRTTFDKRVQKAAEDALSHIFETKVREGSTAQAAIVVLSRDGAVRGIVGGRKSGVAGAFNRATQARRQTGSSFKPFIYAAALQDGWRADTVVVDEPVTLNIPGSGAWSPRNYTNDFNGPMPMHEALARSINTVAVKVSEAVGRDRVKATAEALGVTSPIADGPAIALGASEASLLEMTGAYASILNGGRHTPPYGIETMIQQRDNDVVLAHSAQPGAQVISERAAQQLVWMMNRVVVSGSGGRARIDGMQVAGKTGTTQGARDAWFIGFNADYVIGVWMGYDDNSKLTGVTGSGLPADIWRETMVRVQGDQPPAPLPMLAPPPRPQAPAQVARAPAKERNPLKRAARQVGEDLREAEREAETVLKKVINGIFGSDR
ncbi:MAG: penicillin-binding transpeptidase domain-containing protein [Pseudomonadota bacterium]